MKFDGKFSSARRILDSLNSGEWLYYGDGSMWSTRVGPMTFAVRTKKVPFLIFEVTLHPEDMSEQDWCDVVRHCPLLGNHERIPKKALQLHRMLRCL